MAATWNRPSSGGGSEWGLYKEDGSGAVTFTSFLSVEISYPGSVVSEPVEEGSFASYNKKADALEISVTLGAHGSEDAIETAVNELNVLRTSLDKLTLTTPAASYDSLTLESFNYSRTAESSAYFLTAELKLIEVREVETEVSTTALPEPECKNPGSAGKKSTGKAGTEEAADPPKRRQSVLRSMGIGGPKKEE